MALSDKNIIITPSRNVTGESKIRFVGADAVIGPQTIDLNVYPQNSGTLSFEGQFGQIFSLTSILTGVIYSVNDISGIPLIEVIDDGTVKLVESYGNVIVGNGINNSFDKLQVHGTISASGISAPTFSGNLTGNAATVTNGVYTTGNQTISGTKTFASTINGSITGNAATVTNGVYTTGNQTISGTKTFASTINASITGSAGSAFTPNTLKAASGIGGAAFSGNNSTFGLTGQALALHNLATNGIFVRSGTNIVARSIAASGNGIFMQNGDGVSGNPTIVSRATPASSGDFIVLRDNVGSFAANTGTFNGLIVTSPINGSINGNAATVTNGVYTTGNQTISGSKTFASTINASITGSAGSAFTPNTLKAASGIGGAAFSGNNSTFGLTGQALALHNLATNGIFVRSGTNIVARSIAASGNGIFMQNGDGVSGNPTIVSRATPASSGDFIVLRDNVGSFAANTGTFNGLIVTSPINGSINGNAATVTNGVYTTGDQTISGTKTFASPINGSINGNAATVTNGVYTTGDQTIGGVKTFTGLIGASITGNAATVTNGVYTVGNQTISGNKTFTGVLNGNSGVFNNIQATNVPNLISINVQDPSGVVSAPVGTIAFNISGRMFFKASGTSNLGWTQILTSLI